MFTGADWIVVIGALGAALAGVIGVWIQRGRNVNDSEADTIRKQRAIVVALAEHDRQMFIEAINRLSKTIEDCAETIERHRHAVGDQTAEIRRQKD